MEFLKAVLKAVLTAFLTESFLKEIIVYGLEKLAASTDNKVDDEVIAMVRRSMEPPKETEK
jgi:hypothetical protein